ncbi:GNAT family N-acetyltransferase [Tissierella carlieri]|uniref:GNAT family N-acetyltransferase n=1 Tax=Tissierella carlieri TaxID=689904 RepID=UPI001C104C65|nr:GNAT family N-acetyltransferase [Tissierella carlieri]MBU5313827.1 GNAT family N-acetyltransferase [Tissierella carlieri]
MKYRKIEIDGSYTDEKLELILMQIARWHNLTPKLWRPDYKASTADIEETVQRILNTKKEELFLAIAEDDQGDMQGFIWAYKQEEPQDTVMILSLYVTENYRSHGVATNLKTLLEEWCQLDGIKAIQTTVHYNNTSMLALNQKLGYIPGMVYMTKTLVQND